MGARGLVVAAVTCAAALTTLTGCGTSAHADIDRSVVVPRVPGGPTLTVVDVAYTEGSELTLAWDDGECVPGGPKDLVVDRVAVTETAAAVHVVLLTEPNPAALIPAATVCGGVGVPGTADVRLRQPLGTRLLYDDGTTPATLVRITARPTSLR